MGIELVTVMSLNNCCAVIEERQVKSLLVYFRAMKEVARKNEEEGFVGSDFLPGRHHQNYLVLRLPSEVK